MPTYVYGCETCGHRFEIFQKFSDAPLTECAECGARIRRIFQPAGIVFKGSGWYSKDSRGGAAAASGDGEDGAAKTSDEPAAKPKADDTSKSPAKAAPSSGAAQAAD